MTNIEYDFTAYSHQQIWALIRDLSGDGYAVVITINGDPKPPWNRAPDAGYHWVCRISHDDIVATGVGVKPWWALSDAISALEVLEEAE